MDSHSHTHQPELLAVSDEFRSQLRLLWDAYQPIAMALASDDVNSAQQQLSYLVDAINRISPATLEGSAAEAWSRELADLKSILRQFESVTSIKEFRSRFSLLSDEVVTIYRLFGISSDMTLYELHCPMAFDGRGAVWLQGNDQPQNPYYGASMLKCADRTEQLLPHENSMKQRMNDHQHE